MSKSVGLIGIDVAYILAILGVMFSTSFFILGQRLFMLSHEHYYLFFDFFPALFLFLNGMTVTLTLRDRRISSRRFLAYSGKRGTVLFLIGLLFIKSWPMNIFIASGLFYLMAPLFAQWNNLILRSLGVVSAILSVVMLNVDVAAAVTFEGLNFNGVSFKDLLSFIFFNGYYSILPWFTFFIGGMLFGRGSHRPRGYFPPINLAMVVGIGLAFLVEDYCSNIYTLKNELNILQIPILGAKFFLPSFLIFSLCLITLLLNILLHLFRDEQSRTMVKALHSFASSKYSLFFFHLFFSFLLISISTGIMFRDRVIITVTTLVIMFLSFILVRVWKNKLSNTTPIEWLIKRISGSTKK